MLRLALPVLAEQVLSVTVGFVDMALTGHILKDEAYIAAIGNNAYLLWLLFSLFAAVNIGATALVSRLVGEGDQPLAVRVMNQAFVLGIGFAVAVTLFFFFGSELMPRWLKLEGDAAEFAARYLWIVSLVVPAIMVQVVGVACLRGAGDTVSGFIAMSAVNLVNMAVSFALCTGWAGLPKLGWDGIAWGTAIGHLVGGAIILVFLLRGRSGLRLSFSAMKPDLELMRRLLRIGIPGGADVLLILACHLWFLSIINSLSTSAAAAHGLGIRIESIAYLPATAFQMAACTMAGQFLGAADPNRAKRAVLTSIAWAVVLLSLTGVLFYWCGDWLTLIFVGSSTTPVAQQTIALLKIVAIAMPSLAISIVLTGALRGAGQTRWPLLFTLLGFLLIRIPGAYWLAWDEVHVPLLGLTLEGWNRGIEGAWIAMTIDVVLRSVMAMAYFLAGGWMRTKV